MPRHRIRVTFTCKLKEKLTYNNSKFNKVTFNKYKSMKLNKTQYVLRHTQKF